MRATVESPALALWRPASFHKRERRPKTAPDEGSDMKRVVVAALLIASACVSVARAQDTIRVGWTIPAEEAKYWMMRRPDKFPNLGKGYKIEWSQFQGTSPMTQALTAGALDCATQGVLPIAQAMEKNTLSLYVVAQHVGENKDSFHLYWGVMDDSPIKKVEDLKGKTVGISIIGGGTHGPFALMLKKHGVDPDKDIKLVEVSFPLSEDALRQGRVDSTNFVQPFAARAEAKGGIRKLFELADAVPNIVHIVEACRKDFVDKNPALVTQYVKDITAGMKMALANRDETLKVVNEVMKAPIPVLDTYLLKKNDFAREPGGAPNFAAIQAMFDVYTETNMIGKKLDAKALKHPTIVAPME
jgi:ABC-type nitrate/sulfonate/bicarbonate transport system substrate-binding protein